MIVWGIIVGALLGFSLPDWEGFGSVPGALAGLFAGWALRSAVRKEIAAAGDRLLTRIEAMVGRDAAPPDLRAKAAGMAREAGFEAAAARLTRAPPTASTAPLVNDTALPPKEIDPATRPPMPAPAEKSTPSEPGVIERMMLAARTWLLGGNTIVRAGLVILFVGLSFLARYAAAAGLFPIELRLALIVVVGVALLSVGFRTRAARPGFAVALQGAGIAAIYLTMFAGARMFGVIPAPAALVMMIVVCALGCALALLQNAQGLAVASFLGGFAVPLLIGGPQGSTPLLFGYFTVLNAGILFFAAKRAWRMVSLIGFFATFGMAALWGFGAYNPGEYALAQIFLILSVLLYLAVALLSARPGTAVGGRVVDTTLLLGPAIAGFGLQVALVHQQPLGSAFSALGFAALYIAVAAIMIRQGRTEFRVMNEAMLAIGTGFVTLAIPLALGARWTSSAWAVEGAGAFWIGMRQARWMPRLFGVLLQLVAALLFIIGLGGNMSSLPFVGPGFVGATLIALAVLATAWWLRRAPLAHGGSRWALRYVEAEVALARPAFLFGFAFWWLALVLEVQRIVPPTTPGTAPLPAIRTDVQPLLIMLAYVASAAVAWLVARRHAWSVAAWPARATLIVLALTFLSQAGQGRHILSTPNWTIWLPVIALHGWLLFRDEKVAAGPVMTLLHRVAHIGGAWLATAMIGDCLWLSIDRARLWNTSWAGVAFLVSLVAALLLLTMSAGAARPGDARAARWPLRGHTVDYGWFAALPIAALVLVGALTTSLVAAGYTAPLPYIPLLNPVDLSLMLAIGALLLWRRTMLAADPVPPRSRWLREPAPLAPIGGLAFVVVNTIWLRIAHHMLGVAWETGALLDSFVVQMGIALLWTSLALGLMLFAHRRPDRTIWITGAVLLALVVAKLLLIDLNNEGSAVRIVTFMAVGVLMLVVGYFAPLPPRIGDAKAAGEART